MIYLITGATGDVGSKVVERLIRSGERPRVLVRDANKARSLHGDRVDIYTGDLGDGSSLRTALEGADALFLVNSGPQIPVRDEVAAVAAKDVGLKHLVKLSSMDVQQGLAIGAWHERGEAAIRRSGVPFTFIQPTGFMSNLLAWSTSIKTEAMVRSSTGEGRRAFIHSDDIAAVVTKTLTEQSFVGQSVPITGPEALSFPEVTARIGAAIGKSLKFVAITDDEVRQRYSVFSGSVEETEAHVALWRAIREQRLASVNHNVEQIIGRKAIALDRWITENIDAFRA
jgi:uncharacterized protein YbjT (DUF2867 family)